VTRPPLHPVAAAADIVVVVVEDIRVRTSRSVRWSTIPSVDPPTVYSIDALSDPLPMSMPMMTMTFLGDLLSIRVAQTRRTPKS